MERWYDRLGVQINHPPKERPGPGYERPSVWRRYVSPLRIRVPVYIGTLAVVTVVLIAAGLSALHTLLFGYVPAFGAQLLVEGWWRRKHPPSEDHVSTPR